MWPQRNTNDSKSDVYPDLDLIYNDKCGFKETSYSLCCVKKRIRFQIWSGSELSPKPSLPSAFVWLYTREKDLKSKVCLWSIFWQVSLHLALIPIRGYYFLSSPKYDFTCRFFLFGALFVLLKIKHFKLQWVLHLKCSNDFA